MVLGVTGTVAGFMTVPFVLFADEQFFQAKLWATAGFAKEWTSCFGISPCLLVYADLFIPHSPRGKVSLLPSNGN